MAARTGGTPAGQPGKQSFYIRPFWTVSPAIGQLALPHTEAGAGPCCSLQGKGIITTAAKAPAAHGGSIIQAVKKAAHGCPGEKAAASCCLRKADKSP